MKKVLILFGALLFSAHCLANIDVNQMHSAIQHGFNNNSANSQNVTSITYGGKDISHPKIAVANDKAASISFTTIC